MRTSRRLSLLLVVPALAIAGCGGDSDSKPSAPSEQQLTRQDADAKSNTRNAVSELESCYVDQQSYAPCTTDVGASGGEVSATGTDTGYVVTGKSESGNSFVITKSDDGSSKRTCTTKGKGGCPSSGEW